MRSHRLPLALTFLLAAAPAWAANVERPYENVDKRNDAGGSTGDSKVDDLNKAQLDENQPQASGTRKAEQPRF